MFDLWACYKADFNDWRWFDPDGKEWFHHLPDKDHAIEHWDIIPSDTWNREGKERLFMLDSFFKPETVVPPVAPSTVIIVHP